MVDTDAISFGTDGWRATLDAFTDERVRAVGRAVARYLTDEGHDAPVIVGYDARETSVGFAESLAEVLAARGFDVYVPPRDCPTPVIAWAVVERNLAGALMVTASHNPPEYNGVKFIPDDGAPALPHVTDAIQDRLVAADATSSDQRTPGQKQGRERGTIERYDPVPDHASHAREMMDVDLSGLTVAYDAMYGSGRGITDDLLSAAGGEVIRLRCARDPGFGGTPPEPTPERLAALERAVRDGDATIGIANDGDADRLAVVTPERGVLDGHRTFAVLYDYLLETSSGPAVRTVSTTFLIDRIAQSNGEHTVETAVGFKWVADAMAEHDALIGGEESGGFSIRGHVREKDGVLMALVAAAAHVREPLDQRLDRLHAEHGDVVADKTSVECADERKAATIEAIAGNVPDRVADRDVAEVNDRDGVKLLLEDGSWLLVRPSGTEPKMRVYAEAESRERVDVLLEAGRDLVSSFV